MNFSFKSRFSRNIIDLVRANILSQFLIFLSLPLLTRLFTPQDFGLLAFFSGLATVVNAFSTIRVEWSLPLVRTNAQANSLILLGLIPLLFSALFILFLGPGIFGYVSGIWSDIVQVQEFTSLLALAILVGGVKQILEGCHIRSANLKSIGVSKLVQTSANILLCFGLGLIGVGAKGLFIAWTAGISIGALFLANKIPNQLFVFRAVSLPRFYTQLKRRGNELAFSSMGSFVNRLNQSAFPLLLAINYPPQAVGLYALTHKLAIAPTALLTNAISQSFWAEAARDIQVNPGKLRRLYVKISIKLLVMALIVVTFLALFASFLDGLLGATQWNGAGVVLVAILPMLLGQIAVSPLSHLIVHGKQHWQFFWDIARGITILFALLVLPHVTHSLTTTLVLVALISMFMYAILLFLNLLAYKYPIQKNRGLR